MELLGLFLSDSVPCFTHLCSLLGGERKSLKEEESSQGSGLLVWLYAKPSESSLHANCNMLGKEVWLWNVGLLKNVRVFLRVPRCLFF